MQTVTFQCGRCGKLIAVGVVYLGRQVRCPHCQKVVLAQAPATAHSGQPVSTERATLEPASAVPVSSPPDSSAPAGVATTADSVQSADSSTTILPQPGMPAYRRAFEPEPVLSGPAEPEDSLPRPGPAAELPPLVPAFPVLESPPIAREVADEPNSAVAGAIEPPGPNGPVTETYPGPGTSEPGALAFGETPALTADPGEDLGTLFAGGRPLPARSGVSIWLVLPLVSYSILATVLLVILWNRLQTREVHPLIAFLPDAEGDAPGVIRKPKAVTEARKRRLNAEPLPDDLKLRLGQTRTVGMLAITPQRVAWQQVGVGEDSAGPVKLNGPSLVLHLRLENMSTDETFQPLDRFFDRKWQDGKATAPPLTLLEAGPKLRFYGGPAEWRPRSHARNINAPPEFIYLMGGEHPVADPIDRPLGAGETSEVFVCTDGNDPRTTELARYRGEFLWRVHVRRGLVRVLDREVPAAAVVGVVFSDRDVGS
jgi:DNA-directed RNA polymerase subunit RPC12/RpoP